MLDDPGHEPVWPSTIKALRSIKEEAERDGGYINVGFRSWIDEAIFTAHGDCLGIEGRHVLGNVLEYSTGEKPDYLGLVESATRLEAMLNKALGHSEELRDRVVAVTSPSLLPPFDSRMSEFRLGYHVNVSTNGLADSQRRELMTALAGLVLLTGSGGLCPTGFCVSPQGTTMRRSFVPGGAREEDAPPCIMTEREGVVLSDPWRKESRLHVSCFDSPFTLQGLAVSFGLVQLLMGMMVSGISPTGGIQLRDPAEAYRKWSVDPSAKVRVAKGGRVDSYEVMSAFSSSLKQVCKNNDIDGPCEALIGELRKGIAAVKEGDEGYLAEHFQYYMKKLIYRRVLEVEGITFERLNTTVPALMRATRLFRVGLYRLSRMQPGAVRRRMCKPEKWQTERHSRLVGYMKEHRIDPGELPPLAGLCNKLIAIETRLGLLSPEKSPIAGHNQELWDGFVSGIVRPEPRPTRAEARGRVVRQIFDAGSGESFTADWANIICTRPYPSHRVFENMDVMVLGDPDGSSNCSFNRLSYLDWIRYRDREGNFDDITDELLREGIEAELEL